MTRPFTTAPSFRYASGDDDPMRQEQRQRDRDAAASSRCLPLRRTLPSNADSDTGLRRTSPRTIAAGRVDHRRHDQHLAGRASRCTR